MGQSLFQDDSDLKSIQESIQTLRLDHDLGKITREQYVQHLQSYRLAAAHALRMRTESSPRSKPADLEQRILQARVVLRDSQQGTETTRLDPYDGQSGN